MEIEKRIREHRNVVEIDGDFYYRDYWKIYNTLPDGYYFDRRTSSPLNGYGYLFAVNAPPLKGGRRILVKNF